MHSIKHSYACRTSIALALFIAASSTTRSALSQETTIAPAEPAKAIRATEPDVAAAPPAVSWETIAATMQSAQSMLAVGDAGSTTQRRQRESVEHLDALIAAAAANSAAQNGEPRDPSAEKTTPTGPGDASGTDGRSANPNAVESVERHGTTDAQAPEAAGPRRTAAEEFWGRLPAHLEERFRSLQSAETRAVPKYRAAVEEYFQRLLETQPPARNEN